MHGGGRRLPAGAFTGRRRGVDVDDGHGAQPVVGQHRRAGRVGLVELVVEGGGDLGVPLGPPRGGQVLVDGVADEHVGEARPPLGRHGGLDQPHGFSVLYCMTTSLARGGHGLATMGLTEPVLHELAGSAGFRSVHRVAMDNPINSLYELHR